MDNYKISLNSGFKTIEVNFSDVGESTKISFNASDVNLLERLKDAENKMNGLVDKYTDAEDAVSTLIEINKELCEVVDYAFGNAISGEVFKHCSPLAMVNGEYFIAQFLTQITPIIAKIQQAEAKKMQKKSEKYLEKYKK